METPEEGTNSNFSRPTTQRVPFISVDAAPGSFYYHDRVIAPLSLQWYAKNILSRDVLFAAILQSVP